MVSQIVFCGIVIGFVATLAIYTAYVIALAIIGICVPNKALDAVCEKYCFLGAFVYGEGLEYVGRVMFVLMAVSTLIMALM